MKNILSKILIFATLFYACSDEQTVINTEDKTISTFYLNAISDTTGRMNIVDSVILDGVIKLSFDVGNTNNKIEKGDSVNFYYVGAILNSTNINSYMNEGNVFVTNVDSIAQQCGLEGMIGRGEEKGVAGKNNYIKGLDIGLTMMNEYENALIFFPSRLAYGDNRIGAVPAGSPLIFQIIVTKIKKN
ncbi:MAG: FKBP-type peptidyl-prolyl cis-trans isomerase [Prevotellaceae bacterium]|jgi:FKBP-type peptidyl-prolyl cis-trans isomerase|nr:FKBP-type peptidyl-prolyl cis-trans isomerase [Prevotellaceae bacterium]